MPIELNKILRDIAEENFLKPTANAKKEEIEQAWVRVAKKSNLSVHETKSIFKVLQKKYEQERVKDHSTWKLFEVMNEIHTPADEDEEEEESEISMEENEEYEMLEVDEEQQQDLQQNDVEKSENTKNEKSANPKSPPLKKTNNEMTSDGESPTKSKTDTSHENSPEHTSEKHSELKKSASASQQPSPREEKKVLNSLLSPTLPRLPKTMTPTTAAIALQKKGITLKKANPTQKQQLSQAQQHVQGQSLLRNSHASDVGRTIQLPESIKRKLNEDAISTPTPTKKILLGQPSGNLKQISPKAMTPKTFTQSKISATGSLLMKKENDEKNASNSHDEKSFQNASTTATTTTSIGSTTNTVNLSTPNVTTHHGLKVITFPVETKNEADSANTTGLKVITLPAESHSSFIQNGISAPMVKNGTHVATNGIEEFDFSDHVLISSNAANNAIANSATTVKNDNIPNDTCPDTKESCLNLGNFSNDLPRAFFNNLCNSKRHEALCLYAANVMNRLDVSSAARLELKIMRALLDAQAEALKES